jgi:malate dehydrogenase (oxaloacetate-decarboxylating)
LRRSASGGNAADRLDVGTDNEKHLADPLYIGWQRERVRGPEYDDFVEFLSMRSVSDGRTYFCIGEDFAIGNANRLLSKYRDQLCTFNDDIRERPLSQLGHCSAR